MSLLSHRGLILNAQYHGFCSEYMAVINRAINLNYKLPSVGQLQIQDTLMRTLVSAGVFAKKDTIFVLANDAGMNFARINWKTPGTFDLTDYGTGIAGYILNYGPYVNTEQAAFGMLETAWTPNGSSLFALNDNSVEHLTQSGYGVSGFPYRVEAPNVNATLFYSIDGVRSIYNNSTVGYASGLMVTNNLSWMNRRISSAAWGLVYNNAGTATSGGASSAASTSKSSSNMKVLGSVSNTLVTDYNEQAMGLGHPMQYLAAGQGLTDAQFVAFDNAIQTYHSVIASAAMLITSGNYTVPSGVTEITVECFGGGGAGKGFPNSVQTSTGGGGGGGAYATKVISVTPGQVISYTIGAAGAGTTGAGGNGGDTSWNSGEVLAKGGLGAPSSGGFGAGGLSSTSVGTVKYSGGNGGSGVNALNASTGTGGSGAGALGAGLNGVHGAAGSAIYVRPGYNMLGPGSPGYSLNNASNAAGIPGMLASGGSGARRTTSTRNGGNGGQGYIRVSRVKIY
ncbi:MAG: glycine-rich domain-containing protein [Chryseolinea sp.]